MSGAQVIIAYPREDGQHFDKEYYFSKHMSLVAGHWKKHGLKSYVVTELNADSPYFLATTVYWESIDGWVAATKDESIGEIMADVAKFTNLKPTMLYGSILAGETFKA